MRARTPLVAREVLLTCGAILGIVCLAVTLAATLFGVRVLVFESGSMEPAIGSGDVAVAREVAARDLAPGDIVSVRNQSGTRITHRIERIERDGERATLWLKGDANPGLDPQPYAVTDADRVLLNVGELGPAIHAFSSRLGLLVASAAVLGLLALGFRRTDTGSTGHRRSGAAVGTGLLVVLVAGGLALGPSSTVRTLAAFTDSASAAGSVSTASIPAPTNFACTASLASGFRFSWSSVPGATSYTVSYTGGTANVSSTSFTLPGSLLGVGGAGDATVRANRAFGSPPTTTWSSAPSVNIHYTYVLGVLGLLVAANC
jgi:signal peptidase I